MVRVTFLSLCLSSAIAVTTTEKSESTDASIEAASSLWPASVQVPSTKSKVICYYGSWSHWRSHPGQLSPDAIDPFLCTHLIYSFAKIDPVTFTMLPSDATLDLGEYAWSVNGYKKFNSLKQLNPSLKTQISIGGWEEGSKTFSNLVHNRTAIETFSLSVLSFLIQHNFDGVDLDWEYPGHRSSSRPSDPDNFKNFISFLRETLGEKYLISIAVPGSEYIAKSAYPDDTLFNYIDHVHLMTYDYYGPWTYVVGHTAPLFSRSQLDSRSINASMNYWLSRIASEKLLLGISLYGRTFILRSRDERQPLSLSDGEGLTGTITNIPGVLSYFESCSLLAAKDTIKIWDFLWSAPYAVQDVNWVSMEDTNSITAKATFVKVNNIAGAVIWSLDHDDITGTVCNQPVTYKSRKKHFSNSLANSRIPSKPFPLTSIISNILLEKGISHPKDGLTNWASESNTKQDITNLTIHTTAPSTIIYVSDLTIDPSESAIPAKSGKYTCTVNCDESTQPQVPDLKTLDLNTQSTELTVTNVSLNDVTTSTKSITNGSGPSSALSFFNFPLQNQALVWLALMNTTYLLTV